MVGHNHPPADRFEHATLDLGFGQVHVGDTAVEVDAVASDEGHVRFDGAQQVLSQRIDERVLHRTERATGDHDRDPGMGALEFERDVEPVREDDEMIEVGPFHDGAGQRRGRRSDVEDDRVSRLDETDRGAAYQGVLLDDGLATDVEGLFGAMNEAAMRSIERPSEASLRICSSAVRGVMTARAISR